MNYSNHIPFFIFLYLKAYKESSVRHFFHPRQPCGRREGRGMETRFSKGECVDKFNGERYIQVNVEGGWVELFFVTKIGLSIFSLLKHNFKKNEPWKSWCLQLFCTDTAYFGASVSTDLSCQKNCKNQASNFQL